MKECTRWKWKRMLEWWQTIHVFSSYFVTMMNFSFCLFFRCKNSAMNYRERRFNLFVYFYEFKIKFHRNAKKQFMLDDGKTSFEEKKKKRKIINENLICSSGETMMNYSLTLEYIFFRNYHLFDCSGEMKMLQFFPGLTSVWTNWMLKKRKKEEQSLFMRYL